MSMQWNYILKTLKFTILSQFILNYHQFNIFLERPRSPWEVHAEPLGLRGAQVGNLWAKCSGHLIPYTDKLTYSLTPWSRVLLEKLTGSQLVKKFATFYVNRKFITAFTNSRHLSLPPPPTSQRSFLVLILPSMPGSSNWSLSLRFLHQNSLYTSHLTHTHYMPRPSYLSGFNRPNNIGWGVHIIKIRTSFWCLTLIVLMWRIGWAHNNARK